MFDAERERAYKDTFVENLEQSLTAPACSGAVFLLPAWVDTAWVVIPLTGREITRLVSCIEYGADLLYPDAANEIYYSFVKGLECSMLCDAVLECLQDSGFMQTLITSLQDNGGIPDGLAVTADMQPSETAIVLLDLGAGCTEDDRFGAAYEMVALLNIVAIDILDVLALYSTNVELAQELARKVPLIGEYLSTGAMVAKYMIDIAIDNYLISYNTTSHDDLACAILCRMDGACQMTMQHVLDGYRDALTIELVLPSDATDWIGIAEFLRDIGSIVSDTVVAGSFHWLVLQVFARGSALNSNTARILAIALASASAISPPETCECGDWEHTFLNTNGNVGLDIVEFGGSPPATYDAIGDRILGNCWEAPTGSSYVFLNIDLPLSAHLTNVTINYDSVNSRAGGSPQITLNDGDPNWVGNDEFYAATTQTGTAVANTGTISENITTGKLGILMFIGLENSACPDPSGGVLRVNKIYLSGTGEDPFA